MELPARRGALGERLRVPLDPGTRQDWRAPLRESLDWLAVEVDATYEARTCGPLKDPWHARDAYIDVIAGRGPAVLERFFAAQASAPLDGDGRVEARPVFSRWSASDS